MKFKFQNRQFYGDEIEDFKKVINPLPYYNLPDGEYLIRGSIKEHRKIYWKYKDNWYLIEDVRKDNGHYYCDSTTYMLFPILSEKEWINIRNVGWKRLNKVWQRHLFGYIHWKELHELKFETRLSIHKFHKEFNENIKSNL